MLPPKQGTSEQRELLALFRRLDRQRRQGLLDFARFLAQQDEDVEEPSAAAVVREPLGLPRPEQESVVAAIRRLSENYPMLNKDELLHQASALMTSHVLHGRKAPEVIDELEQLFLQAYSVHVGEKK